MIALISGAARGIGAADGRGGSTGHYRHILDERGRETAREIGGGDPAAVFQHLDVTSEDDWNGAIGHCGPASCSPRSCELRLPPS
jgi:3alpha(or 20beta)-hydroxysteroid dehydrogenase